MINTYLVFDFNSYINQLHFLKKISFSIFSMIYASSVVFCEWSLKCFWNISVFLNICYFEGIIDIFRRKLWGKLESFGSSGFWTKLFILSSEKMVRIIGWIIQILPSGYLWVMILNKKDFQSYFFHFYLNLSFVFVCGMS